MSLAIGKEGQNARLAFKLTGWRIDIKDPESLRDQDFDLLRQARAALAAGPGRLCLAGSATTAWFALMARSACASTNLAAAG